MFESSSVFGDELTGESLEGLGDNTLEVVVDVDADVLISCGVIFFWFRKDKKAILVFYKKCGIIMKSYFPYTAYTVCHVIRLCVPNF